MINLIIAEKANEAEVSPRVHCWRWKKHLRSVGIRKTKTSRIHNLSKCFFRLLSYINNQYEKQFAE